MSGIKNYVTKELLRNKDILHVKIIETQQTAYAKMHSGGLRAVFSETTCQTTEWNCISGKQN